MSEFLRISGGELLSEKCSLCFNPFDLISNEWYLLTAGDVSHYNTMTASWGTMGILWARPVVNAFVRPTRHTYGFMEEGNRFTLSFFLNAEYRKMLAYCGKYSGRDVDKAAACSLTVMDFDGGAGFAEADIVLSCRKLYTDDITPDRMTETQLESYYPQKDYHRSYLGEIESVYQKR